MDLSARRRALVLGAGFFVLFSALVVRLYAIQVSTHESSLSKSEGQKRAQVTIQTPPEPIYDRMSHVLAVSVPVQSVWVNPSAIPDWPAASKILAGTLHLREEVVLDQLLRDDREWLWLKRKVTPEEAAAVQKLLEAPPFRVDRTSKAQKLGLAVEYERRYPFGNLACHVLGHRSDDPSMNEGMERFLDEFVRGRTLTVPIAVDGHRHPLGAPTVDLRGAEAFLTIDIRIQKIVEEKLEAACLEHKPKWAVAIVMDPKTGAILALSCRPSFDPNRPGSAAPGARLNRAVVAPYEPGSAMKPFVCAFAIDQHLATPETKFDCENGLWVRGARKLHDTHPYGILTLTEVIVHSSNIGAAKLGAIVLGPAREYECLRRWGFGSRTGCDLPAEDSGCLLPLSRWTSFSETSVPMGHEISVTPVQLVTAMSAIANGGKLMRPYVTQKVVATDGAVLAETGPEVVRQVIAEKTSRQMIEILKKVVTDGTGKKAAVEGVAVAGKTGTTQKIGRTGQKHENYIATFVGFAPADDAQLCLAVVMDEPQGEYYGGSVCAPVVSKILQEGLAFAK